MIFRINVTEEDIRNGHHERACACPIAIATRRAVSATVFVGTDDVDLWLNGDSINRDLPPEAREFVSKFDKGEPVGPFTFELDLPD